MCFLWTCVCRFLIRGICSFLFWGAHNLLSLWCLSAVLLVLWSSSLLPTSLVFSHSQTPRISWVLSVPWVMLYTNQSLRQHQWKVRSLDIKSNLPFLSPGSSWDLEVSSWSHGIMPGEGTMVRMCHKFS